MQSPDGARSGCWISRHTSTTRRASAGAARPIPSARPGPHGRGAHSRHREAASRIAPQAAQRLMPIALIAHGGAGSWRPGSDEDAIVGVKAAVEEGRAVLRAGGTALDAVCATVVRLEDNPIFNAGTGAVLNFDGFCELDAAVMESRESRAGAVAALQRVKNPILVARKVMEETDHVMLAGEGALRVCRAMGFHDQDAVTPARRRDWEEKKTRLGEVLGKHGLRMQRFLKDHPEYAGGTVGAAAVDMNGILAAATSTGGVTMK